MLTDFDAIILSVLILFSLASRACRKTMCAIIVVPDNYEVRAIVRFLCAKISSAAEIHIELCLVIEPTEISEGSLIISLFACLWPNPCKISQVVVLQ